MGGLHDIGHGVPRDYVKARQWYEKAADQGHAGAQYNLGVLYAEGLGVPLDTMKARELFEKTDAQPWAESRAA
jgi:TPR repeat protein